VKQVSTSAIPFTRAADPLGHTAPLDQRAWFPLLGLPLEIRSNSPAVIAAAERSFGHWRALEPALIEPIDPLTVSVVVHPADIIEQQSGRRQPGTENHASGRSEGSQLKTEFIQRVHGDCFIASSGANLLTARMDHGQALGFVTPELVADDVQFRYSVLECLALLLASWRDRTPIHAGAVAHAGRAALLAGPSAAGKSTLCYACARAGFSLLAEDVVYVDLRAEPRLWGNPWRIHLLPDAPRLFPELADLPAQIQANGKRKLAIDVSRLGAAQPHCQAGRAAVCIVRRHGGRASALTPIEPARAAAALSRDREPGFDLHARAGEAAAALAARGAYQILLGSDLEGAVELLRVLLETPAAHVADIAAPGEHL
jgi:hypothetical protein